MLLYTYMIRNCALLFSLFFVGTYVLAESANDKKIPVEHGIEHPDHIPHHGGKDPVKKIGQDELVAPRKKKKPHRITAA